MGLIQVLLVPAIAALLFFIPDISINASVDGYVYTLLTGFLSIFTVLGSGYGLILTFSRLISGKWRHLFSVVLMLAAVFLWAPFGVLIRRPALFAALIGLAVASGIGIVFVSSARSRVLRLVTAILAILAGLVLYSANMIVLPRLYFKQHVMVQVISWTLVILGLHWLINDKKELKMHISGPISIVLIALAILPVLSMVTLPQGGRRILHEPATSISKAVYILARLTDFDRDGYSSVLNSGDCSPFDAEIHPGAIDRPDNGLDEDCLDGDLKSRAIKEYKSEKKGLQQALLTRGKPMPDVKNVILITLEATRFDVVFRKNPAYRGLLGQGSFFTRAWTAFPATEFSGCGFLASQWPLSVRTTIRNGELAITDVNNRPLPRILESEGFETAAFVVFYKIAEQLGQSMGFKQVWSIPWHKNEQKTTHLITSALTTQKVEEFLKGVGNRRFFVWIHYLDPHAPYLNDQAQALPKNRFVRYMLETSRVAAQIKSLQEYLRSLGLDRDTTIIITSDHGEEFGDHGASYHGSSVYEEQVHVPLLIIGPKIRQQVLNQSVSLTDIAPTILALLGLSGRIPTTWNGSSLKPFLFTDSPRTVQRPVFLEVFSTSDRSRRLNRQAGVVVWPYKLIWHMDSNYFELFDLQKDPKESKNLADSMPGVVKGLIHTLELHLQTANRPID